MGWRPCKTGPALSVASWPTTVSGQILPFPNSVRPKERDEHSSSSMTSTLSIPNPKLANRNKVRAESRGLGKTISGSSKRNGCADARRSSKSRTVSNSPGYRTQGSGAIYLSAAHRARGSLRLRDRMAALPARQIASRQTTPESSASAALWSPPKTQGRTGKLQLRPAISLSRRNHDFLDVTLRARVRITTLRAQRSAPSKVTGVWQGRDRNGRGR
jgi:hypothetical protein